MDSIKYDLTGKERSKLRSKLRWMDSIKYELDREGKVKAEVDGQHQV